MARGGTVGSFGDSSFRLLRLFHTAFLSGHAGLHPISIEYVFPFPTQPPAFAVVCFLGQGWKCRNVEHILKYLLGVCVSSLENSVCSNWATFQLGCFLVAQSFVFFVSSRYPLNVQAVKGKRFSRSDSLTQLIISFAE